MAASGDQQETLCKCVQRLRLVFATVAIRPWRWNDLTGIGLKMGLVIAWRIGKLEPWHSEEANLDIHQLCGHFPYKVPFFRSGDDRNSSAGFECGNEGSRLDGIEAAPQHGKIFLAQIQQKSSDL